MGGCLSLKQVESVASPGPYPARKHAKKPNDRLTCSDFSNSTTPADLSSSLVGTNLHKFSLAELKVVCQNFNTSNYLAEGGFGPVFKGFVDEKIVPGLKGQSVAVKQMDLEGVQGHKEWLTEVILLGQLRHPHLVKLIGYCYEDEHRMLIYEYMTRGSLDNHLFNKYFATLPWKTRIQIAIGAAKGLQFLHETDQQVIYRDFKASNILLDSEYKAKLSDFGLAKDGPQGDDTHVSTRVMGTQGYAAPEYLMTGHLTAKSDVYSFGVVLLEILTGRQSLDETRPSREQNLVDWAKYFLNDSRKLSRIMDPALEGQYSTKGAQKAAALAYQCLSYLPKNRPDMSTVVKMLEPLQDLNDIPLGTFVFNNVKEREGSNDKKPNEGSSSGVEPKRENRQQQEKQQRGGHGRRRNPGSVNHSDTALYRRKSADDNGL